MCGLKDSEVDILKSTFLKYPKIKKAILYGSRAMDTFRDGSDIDIVLFGDNLKDELFYIYDELEERLPYFIDINLYELITNEKLKQHIKNVGKVIYMSMTDNGLQEANFTTP